MAMIDLKKKHIELGMLGAIMLFVLVMVPIVSEASVHPQDRLDTTWDSDIRPILDHDSRMAELEKDIPGFGGVFMRDGTLTIYVVPDRTNLSQTLEERKTILGSHVGPHRLDKGLVVLEGQYTYSELAAVKNHITPLLEKSLGMTLVGVDDKTNRVSVGIETADMEEKIRTEISQLGIEEDVVYIEVTGKFELSSHTQKYRPMIGGILLAYHNGTDVIGCSLGIAADHGTHDRVIATAGHCRYDSDPDGTNYYQNSYSSDYIGNGISGTNPSGARYSDTVLIDPTVTNTKGAVHTHSGTITLSGKQYTQLPEDSVTKSGQTTHDTSGEILAVCQNVSHETYGTLYCQTLTDYNSDLGDSGSTVYGWDSESESYKWFGIHWGGNDDYAAYSPIWNIEVDQGTLTIS